MDNMFRFTNIGFTTVFITYRYIFYAREPGLALKLQLFSQHIQIRKSRKLPWPSWGPKIQIKNWGKLVQGFLRYDRTQTTLIQKKYTIWIFLVYATPRVPMGPPKMSAQTVQPFGRLYTNVLFHYFFLQWIYPFFKFKSLMTFTMIYVFFQTFWYLIIWLIY